MDKKTDCAALLWTSGSMEVDQGVLLLPAVAAYHDVDRVRDVGRYASLEISLDRIEERAVERPVENASPV
jgi:hypothetical protein